MLSEDRHRTNWLEFPDQQPSESMFRGTEYAKQGEEDDPYPNRLNFPTYICCIAHTVKEKVIAWQQNPTGAGSGIPSCAPKTDQFKKLRLALGDDYDLPSLELLAPAEEGLNDKIDKAELQTKDGNMCMCIHKVVHETKRKTMDLV